MSQSQPPRPPHALTGSIYTPGKVHGRLITEGAANAIRARGNRETSDYSRKSRPWIVQLTIMESGLSLECITRLYFVRAPDPYLAGFTAAKVWQKWEKDDVGKGHLQFPATAGPAITTCIDEQDYMNFWKESEQWPRMAFMARGSKTNPVIFTYITDQTFAKLWFGNKYFNPPPSEAIPV